MPHHDNDRPRKGLIIALCVGAGLTAFVLGAGAMAAFGWLAKHRPADAGPAAVASNPEPQATKVFTRKEFEAAVINKSKDEIIAAVGRPDDTTDQVTRPRGVISFLAEYWIYKDRVANEATGKTYLIARVYMDNGGRAYKVDYP